MKKITIALSTQAAHYLGSLVAVDGFENSPSEDVTAELSALLDEHEDAVLAALEQIEEHKHTWSRVTAGLLLDGGQRTVEEGNAQVIQWALDAGWHQDLHQREPDEAAAALGYLNTLVPEDLTIAWVEGDLYVCDPE